MKFNGVFWAEWYLLFQYNGSGAIIWTHINDI